MIVVLALIAFARLWLPAIRWFVPDRYIMAYAPERIAQMIFEIEVDELVPTPAASNNREDALLLLDTLAPTPSPTPTELPEPTDETAFPTPQGYIQPTRVPLAPTPTTTLPAVAS
nr:hypothetical protein [Anaerolineae bacterium]